MLARGNAVRAFLASTHLSAEPVGTVRSSAGAGFWTWQRSTAATSGAIAASRRVFGEQSIDRAG